MLRLDEFTSSVRKIHFMPGCSVDLSGAKMKSFSEFMEINNQDLSNLVIKQPVGNHES